MDNKPKNNWGLGALVAGILSIILDLGVGTGGVILAIITIICGIMGLVKYKKNPDIGGLWTSIAGILIVIISFIILFVLAGLRRGAF